MESKKKQQVVDLISKFRGKLNNNGQSLKWWHEKYLMPGLRYDYFIRQINNIELISIDTVEAIKRYLEVE